MPEHDSSKGNSARSRLLIPIISLALLALIGWFIFRPVAEVIAVENVAESISQRPSTVPSELVPGDALLEGYGDPNIAPIEDLRKLHRIITGYFSVIKDSSRFPIGGNADLAAALRGENANREVFIRPGHKIFSAAGNLADRWGGDILVHPEAWRRIELRSAGPDRIAYNEDDIILAPGGFERTARGGE